MKLLCTACFLLYLGSHAIPSPAQQNVPPPPKPKDDGPTLDVTFKFLQEAIDAVGKLNEIDYIHDNKDGADWSESWTFEISQFRGNTDVCGIDYHRKHTHDSKPIADQDVGQLLKDVKEIRVVPREEKLKEADSKAGHPEWSTKVEPSIYVVTLKLGLSNISNVHNFYFSDEILANRVAKAFNHAVELCGGGSKDPF